MALPLALHYTPDEMRPAPPHPRLRRALAHLHARFPERLALGELAMVAGLSPFYFARLFRAQTGHTPGSYLRHLRIERAKALLEDGVPISHVAYSTGFYDQSHFTRRFKQDVGVSPGRWARVEGGVGDAGSANEAPMGQLDD